MRSACVVTGGWRKRRRLDDHLELSASKQASNEKGRSLALPGRRHFVETFWRLSLSVYPIPYADVSHISVTRSLE